MKDKIEALGIDIGGTSIKAAFVDEGGHLDGQFVVPVDAKLSQEELLGLVIKEAKKALKDHPGCIGIGIGCPGAINPEKGTCDYSNNLHWRDFHVVEAFRKEIDLPAYIENDANAALLGDVQFGVGKNYKNIIFITLGTGVGGGILINGQIYSGNEGKGAELGHSLLEIDGRECSCGRRGCLESYASASALCRDGAKAMKEHKDSLLWTLCPNPDEMNARFIFEAEEKGDPTAKKVLEDYFHFLGEGCLNFINIFRPEALIFSGGLTKQGDKFGNRVKAYLAERNYGYGGTVSPKVDVLVSKLGSEAGIYGAAALAYKARKA